MNKLLDETKIEEIKINCGNCKRCSTFRSEVWQCFSESLLE